MLFEGRGTWRSGWLLARHQAAPRIGAAQKRMHAGNSVASQEQRRTGAGGFVWSSTEEHNIAVSWNFPVPQRQLFS